MSISIPIKCTIENRSSFCVVCAYMFIFTYLYKSCEIIQKRLSCYENHEKQTEYCYNKACVTRTSTEKEHTTGSKNRKG